LHNANATKGLGAKAKQQFIMLNLEKCKKLLEQNGNHYTDEQVKQIRQLLYKMGNLDYYLTTQKKEKKCKQ
jgi:hypothetical protein